MVSAIAYRIGSQVGPCSFKAGNLNALKETILKKEVIKKTQSKAVNPPLKTSKTKKKVTTKNMSSANCFQDDSNVSMQKLAADMRKMKITLDETREQLGFVYGVLEEIAERQEIQSEWQLEVAKNIFMMGADKMLLKEKNAERMLETSAETEDMLSAIANIFGNAESALKKRSAKRKEEKIIAIKKTKDFFNGISKKDEPEQLILVMPSEDEIH